MCKQIIRHPTPFFCNSRETPTAGTQLFLVCVNILAKNMIWILIICFLFILINLPMISCGQVVQTFGLTACGYV